MEATTMQQLAVKGRTVEIWPDPKANGTWPRVRAGLVQEIVRAQQAGEVVCYVDAAIMRDEGDRAGHGLDLRDARDAGVECSRLLLSQPQDMAQVQDVVEALVRSAQLGLVIVGGLPSKHRWPEKYARKLSALLHETQTALILGRVEK